MKARDLVMDMAKKHPMMGWRQVAVAILAHEAPRDAPQTVRGMAAVLDINKPAVTRALDALEDAGFYQRRRDPADKRSVLVSQTAAGRKFVERLLAA